MLKHAVLFVVYGVLALVLAFGAAWSWHLDRQPDPHVWHSAPLGAEYRARNLAVKTLADYRALEDRLFAELESTVYAAVPHEARRRFNRYSAGSLADARGRTPDWNRTIELVPADAKAGALLLHGLSDSPYSMRALAERLHARGVHVVVLRLPGHGTAPSGLLDVHWRDWAGAVRIAARDLRAKLGDAKPLHVVGYSTGASLALEYVLARRGGEPLPAIDRVGMLSPMIGIAPVARFAEWQARAARLVGSAKMNWIAVGVEYDPYKYASFTVNAGVQAWNLVMWNAARLAALDTGGGIDLPPVLAFVSAADATVTSAAVPDVLFARLTGRDDTLVLFDVDRISEADPLIDARPAALADRLLTDPQPSRYRLEVLGNTNPQSRSLVVRERARGETTVVAQPTTLAWPDFVFATSHVALPFPPDDPVYGAAPPAQRELVYLGRTALLGERGLLNIPAADLARLRYNPFFPFVEARTLAFLGLASPEQSAEAAAAGAGAAVPDANARRQ